MKQQKHKQALSIIAVLLFGLYLSTDLLNSLHNAVVHQNTSEEVCSMEQEEDACHRTIYHQGNQDKCEHTEHFIPQTVNCELCSIIHHRHTLPNSEMVLIHTIKAISTITKLAPKAPQKSFQYAYPLRGPPTFS